MESESVKSRTSPCSGGIRKIDFWGSSDILRGDNEPCIKQTNAGARTLHLAGQGAPRALELMIIEIGCFQECGLLSLKSRSALYHPITHTHSKGMFAFNLE